MSVGTTSFVTQSTHELFRDRIFYIPQYQRGYAWEEEHIAALWNDVMKDQVHFMANIILEKSGRSLTTATLEELPIVNVVDGQQRLTTLVIILYVLGKELTRLGANQPICNAIYTTYVAVATTNGEGNHSFFYLT
jgi:uncharacterized protein with ParB-like and HNH nuclease domain